MILMKKHLPNLLILLLLLVLVTPAFSARMTVEEYRAKYFNANKDELGPAEAFRRAYRIRQVPLDNNHQPAIPPLPPLPAISASASAPGSPKISTSTSGSEPKNVVPKTSNSRVNGGLGKFNSVFSRITQKWPQEMKLSNGEKAFILSTGTMAGIAGYVLSRPNPYLDGEEQSQAKKN